MKQKSLDVSGMQIRRAYEERYGRLPDDVSYMNAAQIICAEMGWANGERFIKSQSNDPLKPYLYDGLHPFKFKEGEFRFAFEEGGEN